MLSRLLALAAAAVVLAPTAAAATLTRPETSILREMNRVRVANGLRPLRVDNHLERAARAHTREMVAANVFDHGAFGSRMMAFKVQGRMTGENLAWGAGPRGTPPALVAAWLASPGHRENLLRPQYTRVGVGAYVGRFLGFPGVTLVTTDFAG